MVEAFRLASSDEKIVIRLYSLELLTREEDAFVKGNVSKLVWKWAKADSLYLKCGHWCSTIEEAATNRVWKAGSGFSVFVDAVGEPKKNSMFEGGKKPVIIPRTE